MQERACNGANFASRRNHNHTAEVKAHTEAEQTHNFHQGKLNIDLDELLLEGMARLRASTRKQRKVPERSKHSYATRCNTGKVHGELKELQHFT